MNIYRQWHFQSCHKLEFSYFSERMQKLGTDKAMKGFMTRLRKMYKGDDHIEGFVEEFKKPEETKNLAEQIDTSAALYQDPYLEYEKDMRAQTE